MLNMLGMICWRETVYAVRHIEEGEEITLSYHAFGPSTERQKELKDYFGFKCACEYCSLPPDQLKASDERLVRAQRLDEAIGDPSRAQKEPEKVLADCRILEEIYKEEGIADQRLTRLYWDAFQICAKHSDKARAKVFAKKYRDRMALGESQDFIEVIETIKYVRDPAKYEDFGDTQKWKTSIK